MASWFELELDLLAPSNYTFNIENNAVYSTTQLVNVYPSSSDTDITYFKVWGDLDLQWCKDNSIVGASETQITENTVSWIPYQISKQVKLSSGDGSKTLSSKSKDDVDNESSIVTDSIILNTSLPVGTIIGNIAKISKVSGKNVCSFTIQSDSTFDEFKVMIVENENDAVDASTNKQIGTTYGSTNVLGTAGGYAANTPITGSITGADFEVANSGGGKKKIKLFVKETNGNWSI